mgnify:CR=1 FL=1
MTVFSNNNTKMKKSARPGEKFVAFGLPPIKTCPQAGACKDGCYACAGRMAMQAATTCQEFRYALSQRVYFLEYLEDALREVQRPGIKLYVRLHDSGDFYSREYLRAWIKFASMHPDVIFYAYTKCVSMVKAETLPDNMIIAFSYGGLEDNLIDPAKDRHVIVVESENAIPKGYADGSKDDHAVLENRCIALVYHNSKKKWGQTHFQDVQVPEVV